MDNKNSATVTVSKKRLEKLIYYVDMFTSNCSECPAFDVCDTYEACADALWGYLKGMKKIMIKTVTNEEARQALKTIAQYCDMKDCYECDIKDACEKLEMKKYPFFFLAEWERKKT